ncbi:tRNA (adenosine(37)-N6)-dimethylallyltransferase MiaA [Halieaceae bacterium IMCC14734]|uniref:tRNA dimethylallyltransferase n=1 Tax=Candidatus Litorirhabdus singularis TaxID=2518993 RepID=A0ABT3TL63_9GAMM|nr:tRNA (adenosine(37)-N6)-dimethylallyltransferase MiaA [Candidatus Litorirhabdus singularis]MCX2982729.1 tRNA (adenosine(37)-N6)-dimethylallyltransferase MiaA [Candidatus Litorirhabdus singularis]
MGPTASGKTDLAIALAAELDCELVSVDSALVYRGLDIGSAKPDYPHRLVDIRDPGEPYSAAEFVTDATVAIAEIQAAGRTPLLVGGTMLYFKALLEGMAPMPAASSELRAQINSEAATRGWEHIHAQLAAVDPASAARIHPNHSQRLSRAWEVWLASGVTLTEWHSRQAESEQGLLHSGMDIVQLAIGPADRSILHQRIARRLDVMFTDGLVAEVTRLHQRGDLNADLPAIRAVGYRQVWEMLEGVYDQATAYQKCLAATRQLAKRQLTWLRGWPDVQWIYTNAAGFAAPTPELLEKSSINPTQQALKYLAAAPIDRG